MQTLACVHTAHSNVALFDLAAAAPGREDLVLRHVVREDLLQQATAAGGLTPGLAREVRAVLAAAAASADKVILTCSSLGPAADDMDPAGIRILRADRALARAAVAGGGRLAVLYAAPSSAIATRALFAEEAAKAGAVVEVRQVHEAWDAFLAGNLAHYLELVRRAVRAAAATGCDRIALAQASMAPAADASARCPVLTVPAAALAAALTRPAS